MRNKKIAYPAVKYFLMVLLFITVLCPLGMVIATIRMEDIQELLEAGQLKTMLSHSIVVTGIATMISVLLALLLAWCINRSRMRWKGVFSVLFTIPMLIPSISHGMGLVLLLGDNGMLSNWFGIKIPLYGYLGMIMGSVLYSFPVAFLMLTDIFQYEDYTAYEAARVLGLSKAKQFWTITIPNIKKTLISTSFAVFTLIFTDYGVPLIIGGKIVTLPLYMYREVVGQMNISKGAVIGMLLLLPAVVAFLLDLRQEETTNSSTITKQYVVLKNKRRDRFAYFFCIVTVLLISLPVFAFLYLSIIKQYPIDPRLSLDHIKEAFQLGVGRYLKNSLAIALTTSFIGTVTAYITAFLTARSKRNWGTQTLHLISMVSLAIPGIVLGLAYVLFFRGSWIYGTLMMLVLVNMVHFFASPYLLAYNSLSKFNQNLEDVAATLGIAPWRMLKDVYLKCTQKTILEMFSYIFVNAMVTISAVSFLADFRTMPLALLIPQFESQSLMESTAFISIIILAVNGLMKLAVFCLKRTIPDVTK